MGLDMFLRGKKFFWNESRTEDGLKITELQVELAYWRKHPNLHGYIVRTFANDVDECQEIELLAENLEEIITACKLGKLPETSGFFFGVSPSPDDGSEYDEQVAYDVDALQKALVWLKTKEPEVSRSVVYRASW